MRMGLPARSPRTGQTNIVDVLVRRLREKIDRPFETRLLHTVRGVGYVLRPGA